MNLAKAQYEIISEYFKRQNKGGTPILFDKMDNTPYVGVITVACFAYIFNKNDFLIDTARMKLTTAVTNAYGYRNETISIKWNGVLKNIDKKTVAELINENGEITWLDMKYVKKFGEIDSLQFKQCNKRGAVLVYDISGENLIGIIMPIVKNNAM